MPNVQATNYQAYLHAQLCADWLALVNDAGSMAWANEVIALMMPNARQRIISAVYWLPEKPKGMG